MMFHEINAELVKLGEEIEKLGADITLKRYEFQVKEATYKRNLARFCMEAKAKDADKTQTDINAEATVLAFEDRMSMIRAESAYRSVVETIRAKRDKMEGLKEISFNLRRESQVV